VHHPGISTPESLRGSPGGDLTLGIALGACMRRWGFTDLSRLMDGIAPVPGNVTYPTRNFATLGPFVSVTPDRDGSGARTFLPSSSRRRKDRTISSRLSGAVSGV
jgi:hypothetical protein